MSGSLKELVDRLFGEDGQQRMPPQSAAPDKTITEQNRADKVMYENLSEDQIDKTLKDSFPASDPPSY